MKYYINWAKVIAMVVILISTGHIVSCGENDDHIVGKRDCGLALILGLKVTLIEPGSPYYISGATVSIENRSYSEILKETSSNQYEGARGMTGTYKLSAKKSGYRDETRSHILIPMGSCGQPMTQTVDVIMFKDN